MVCFQNQKDGYATINDAIGDLKLDNENATKRRLVCEVYEKSAKYKWLKRLPKNPDKVVSVGDDVVPDL